MKKNNQDIREKILKSHLKYWQIAEQLNINDGNFSRMLRKELPKEAKEKINNIIETIKRKEKMSFKQIVNIKELSKYLCCSVSKIRKMIYENSIPYFRIGNRYMFDISTINIWITELHKDIDKFNNNFPI